MNDLEAMFYRQTANGVKCNLCPWECDLPDGSSGRCNTRRSQNGRLIAESYGMVTSASLDPIEKKPLMHFYPGRLIFSIGLYGCNFHCPFCQNYHISMVKPEASYVTPQEVTILAEKYSQTANNLGVAYTYNEPLIAYEYVMDCAKLIRSKGLKNVVVTNGCIAEEPFDRLLPYIDAFNIDLKGSDSFYQDKLGGEYKTVKRNIRSAAALCHVEVTKLIIPGENDSDAEMEDEAKSLAGINPDLPLHLSRFMPQYKYAHKKLTAKDTMYRLRDIAKKHLQYVYLGNL